MNPFSQFPKLLEMLVNKISEISPENESESAKKARKKLLKNLENVNQTLINISDNNEELPFTNEQIEALAKIRLETKDIEEMVRKITNFKEKINETDK